MADTASCILRHLEDNGRTKAESVEDYIFGGYAREVTTYIDVSNLREEST